MMNNYNPFNFTGYNFMQPVQQQNNDERIWVQNRTAAEAYLVAPNSFVRLWDSQQPVFYEKRADGTGRPYPLETFRYSRVEAQESHTEPVDAQGNNSLLEQLKRLETRVCALEKGGKENEPDTND